MIRITKHSKERIVERDEDITNFSEAKRTAKIAWNSGKTINDFCEYPKFFSYLQNKKSQSRTCRVRIYRGNIYIWRGNCKTLRTAHPIPDRYIKEINGNGY